MNKNKVNMTVWWLFLLIFLEMVYRLFIVGDFLSFNTFSVILFTIPWAILFSIITNLFNSKINRVLNIILSFLDEYSFAKIITNPQNYKKAPLPYLIFSNIRNEMIKTIPVNARNIRYEVKGAWTLVSFQY